MWNLSAIIALLFAAKAKDIFICQPVFPEAFAAKMSSNQKYQFRPEERGGNAGIAIRRGICTIMVLY
jgi:hypothetical protein